MTTVSNTPKLLPSEVSSSSGLAVLPTGGSTPDEYRLELQRKTRGEIRDTPPLTQNEPMTDQEIRQILLQGKRDITLEEAKNSSPTEAGQLLANALLRRNGVGNDFTYTKGEDGYCLQKVNDAMQSAGIPITRVRAAKLSADVLAKSPSYIEVKGPITQQDLEQMPIGTVVVGIRQNSNPEDPKNHGHIQVRVAMGGKYDWCSDFRHGSYPFKEGKEFDNIRVFIPVGSAQTIQLQRAAPTKVQPAGNSAPVIG